MVPLARAPLPGSHAIQIAGPGPTELDLTKPPSTAPEPPNKEKQQENPGVDQDGGDDDDDEVGEGPESGDPYANLGNAFGPYLTDSSRSMNPNQPRKNDLDDLLL